MSTRSMIAVIDNDDHVHAIYCHFDGYIEGVGATLVECWNSKSLAMSLIMGGNLRALGVNTSDNDKFDGEPFVSYDSFDDFLSDMKDSDCEYLYVYTNDRWIVLSDVHEVCPLKEAV